MLQKQLLQWRESHQGKMDTKVWQRSWLGILKVEKKVKTLKSCTKHCWPFPLQVWLLRECSALLVGCSTREEHQWVIPPWMILFSWSLTLNAKKVTKMSVSDLPYLLPSWQNILCSLFVRFCRQKTSFFSFFDKNKFSRNLEGLVRTFSLNTQEKIRLQWACFKGLCV